MRQWYPEGLDHCLADDESMDIGDILKEKRSRFGLGMKDAMKFKFPSYGSTSTGEVESHLKRCEAQLTNFGFAYKGREGVEIQDGLESTFMNHYADCFQAKNVKSVMETINRCATNGMSWSSMSKELIKQFSSRRMKKQEKTRLIDELVFASVHNVDEFVRKGTIVMDKVRSLWPEAPTEVGHGIKEISERLPQTLRVKVIKQLYNRNALMMGSGSSEDEWWSFTTWDEFKEALLLECRAYADCNVEFGPAADRLFAVEEELEGIQASIDRLHQTNENNIQKTPGRNEGNPGYQGKGNGNRYGQQPKYQSNNEYLPGFRSMPDPTDAFQKKVLPTAKCTLVISGPGVHTPGIQGITAVIPADKIEYVKKNTYKKAKGGSFYWIIGFSDENGVEDLLRSRLNGKDFKIRPYEIREPQRQGQYSAVPPPAYNSQQKPGN